MVFMRTLSGCKLLITPVMGSFMLPKRLQAIASFLLPTPKQM